MSNPFHISSLYRAYTKRRSILDRTLFFVVLSTFSLSLFAAQFYRYKNENGQLVLTQTMPAKYADKGYDILNEKGRIIKSVAPALSAEQIAKRDAEIEQQRLAKIEAEKQDAIDEELKQLYSQPNDAVRVLNRRVIDIDDVIKIKRTKIKSIEAQILEEESRAATRQRKGLPVGDDALNKLASLKKDIENTEADIKELYNELERVMIEFDQKIKRLEIITQNKASDYPEVLASVERIRQSKVTEE